MSRYDADCEDIYVGMVSRRVLYINDIRTMQVFKYSWLFLTDIGVPELFQCVMKVIV